MMMKAAVYRQFGGPIVVEEIPLPKVPPGGVVLQVMATGVCRSDWHGWKGHDDDIHQHGLPFVPGHEVAGIIVEVGAHDVTTSLRVGDRVAVPFILSCGKCVACQQQKRPTVCHHQEQPGFTQFGSMAEFLAIPRAERNLRKIPLGVSFVQAAALGCRFTTAYRAILQQGRLISGETVAIFGCGGLGLSCIMLAAAQGAAKIIAIDISNQALEKAKSLGATHVLQVDRSVDDPTVLLTGVEQLTDGLGVDLSVDAAGFKSTCESAVWCARRAGRMVQVGLPIGGKAPPQIPMGRVVARELELIGSHGFAADDMPDLLRLVEQGKLDPGKLVEREVNLQEGAKAIEDMDHLDGNQQIGITMVTKFRDTSSKL